MTILEDAKNGNVNKEMLHVAEIERIDIKQVLKKISKGEAVIMKRENYNPVGIGFPFRTKINVNLGTSSSAGDISEEFKKVEIAQKYGADTLSDLSMGGDIDTIRRNVLDISRVPITTVPIYQATIEADSISNISEDLIFKVVEKQLKDGISSIVLHSGFTLDTLNKMKGKRIMKIVSKGGSLTASYMKSSEVENPFLQNFEKLLELIKEYDVVLNLGNALRSGCIHDEIDEFQLSEIKMNNRLAKTANNFGIQVILESLGGHIPAKNIMKWVKLHKKITNNRPLFVSGPLPIDTATGYDHIAAAIGGAFASGFGADYICAITPAEHLCLPTLEDIKNGLIACKIAAHVGDSMKFGLNYLFNDDLELSKNRYLKNWKEQFEYCIDPDEPKKRHLTNGEICTMCGKHCALSISKKIL
ncbi:MAG: phosphomethylpyrimidine synthase ThiC [Candidatus Lokiarchaeota archaeon]|nr:phosphomethylpyrimidine synthase ThiC [Candidatus Lokiarchaeota archaeon]